MKTVMLRNIVNGFLKWNAMAYEKTVISPLSNTPSNMVGKFVNFIDLDPVIQDAIKKSIDVREKAYSKYSNFKVGASLIGKSGVVYTGCNVENVSYGLSICAERTALVKAVSCGETTFQCIIVCAVANGELVSPCGACRQFICEFAKESDIIVYLTLPDLSKIMETSSSQMLPLAFKSFPK